MECVSRRDLPLVERLRGITSLCFVLQQKVHIKGFSFEKKNRAFAQNFAAECDHILATPSRSMHTVLRV
jgi:hypothetical protein